MNVSVFVCVLSSKQVNEWHCTTIEQYFLIRTHTHTTKLEISMQMRLISIYFATIVSVCYVVAKFIAYIGRSVVKERHTSHHIRLTMDFFVATNGFNTFQRCNLCYYYYSSRRHVAGYIECGVAGTVYVQCTFVRTSNQLTNINVMS